MNVAVNYSRSESDAQKTVGEIQQLGRKAIAIRADVSDQSAVESMFRTVDQTMGRIDILINNAATTRFVPYTDLDGLTDEIWDSIISVNVKGVFYCCRESDQTDEISGQRFDCQCQFHRGVDRRGE